MVTRFGIALVLLSLGGSLPAAEPLAWKFAQGKSWEIETERTVTTVSTHPGSNSKIVSKTNITSTIVVDAVKGDGAAVTETVSAIRATVQVDNSESVGGKRSDRLEKVEYDSANPNAPASTRAARELKAKLAPLVGEKKTYFVQTRGSRISLSAEPDDNGPKVLGGIMLPPAEEIPGGPEISRDEVAEDGSWKSESLLRPTQRTRARLAIVWKRDSAAGDVVKISGAGTFTSLEPTIPWKEASYTATADFDTAAGALVTSETTSTVTMNKQVREKNIDATTTVKTTTAWKELPSQ